MLFLCITNSHAIKIRDGKEGFYMQPCPLYPLGKRPSYPLDRRLGWSRGNCKEGIKLLLLPGIKPHFQRHSAHGLITTDPSHFSCILWHTISQITCIHFTWDICSIMYTFEDSNKIKFKQYLLHSHIACHSSNSMWLLYVLL
jgi:hypothetical protein